MEETLFKLTNTCNYRYRYRYCIFRSDVYTGLSATGTTTMKIPFYANDSEPGSRIECTTGDRVAVYNILNQVLPGYQKGSFIVPSAGGTVSI